MTDWGLGGRADILEMIDALVQAHCTCAGTDGILLYPGSGDDVANPLYAAASRVRTFVFVDNWQGGGSDQPLSAIDAALRGKFPSGAELAQIGDTDVAYLAATLHITAAVPMLAYQFTFKGVARRLLFVRDSLEHFLSGNAGFECHVFLVKDLAGTDSSVTFEMSLPRLVHLGLLMSNALDSDDAPFLPLFGLQFLTALSGIGFGEMVVAQKVRQAELAGVRQAQQFQDQLMQAAQAFFSDNSDEFDFLSGYMAVQAREVEILARAMWTVKRLLGTAQLTDAELYELCRACVKKQSWVLEWQASTANAIYDRAWQYQRFHGYTWAITSRPVPPRLHRRTPPSRRLGGH